MHSVARGAAARGSRARTSGVAVAVHASTRGGRRRCEQRADAPVVGAEVVAPLRDAVGLVDRDELHVAARERLDERVGREALGRRVDELVPPAQHGRLAAATLVGIERRGEEGRRHAARLERAHLVFHERDERREHERRALEHGGRHLVGERLAAARGRHDEHPPAAREQRVDGLALPRAELLQVRRRCGERRQSGSAGVMLRNEASCARRGEA